MERFKKLQNARQSRRSAMLGGWINKGRVRTVRRESAVRFLAIAFG